MKASEIYYTSKDYTTLCNLAKSGNQIVCLVEHISILGNKTMDVAIVNEDLEIRSRGVNYCMSCPDSKKPKYWFIEQCEKLNLEWIIPARTTKA